MDSFEKQEGLLLERQVTSHAKLHEIASDGVTTQVPLREREWDVQPEHFFKLNLYSNIQGQSLLTNFSPLCENMGLTLRNLHCCSEMGMNSAAGEEEST